MSQRPGSASYVLSFEKINNAQKNFDAQKRTCSLNNIKYDNISDYDKTHVKHYRFKIAKKYVD